MSSGDEFELPPLTLHQLKQKAADFLTQYNPKSVIPTPIEEIIEQLDVSILPVPRLEREHSIDSYLSNDGAHIIIDQTVYDSNENRSRFSLAHELGHILLHRKFYLAHPIHTPAAVLGFQVGLTEQQRKYMENQAHTFSAHLLMPPELFEGSIARFQHELGSLDNFTITEAGLLAAKLTDEFGVSGLALLKHFKRYAPELYALLTQN